METNKILSADILDILFENKNKDYGAYDLRKNYNKRMCIAMCITGAAIIIFACSFIYKTTSESIIYKPIIDSIHIEAVKEKTIPPPPKPLPPPPPVRTAAFPPPLIVKDNSVIEPPVENAKLDDARIDIKAHDGIDASNIITPPEEITGSQVSETPKSLKKEIDSTYIQVQIEASFPGDWNNYVKKEIEKNIDELSEAGQSGTCVVKFVVSKDGDVSNVEAITMKGTKLAEIAVNTIRKGPKWNAAIQNGIKVNAYRLQPITFKLDQ